MDWKGEKRACNDNSGRRVLSLYVAAKSMYKNLCVDLSVTGKCFRQWVAHCGCAETDKFRTFKASKVDKSEGCFFQLRHLKLCCTSKAVALRPFHKLELKVMSYLTLDMRLAHKQQRPPRPFHKLELKVMSYLTLDMRLAHKQRPPEEYTELHTEAWWFAKLLIPGKFALNILISTFGISLDPRSNMISAFCMLPSSPCSAERDYQFKQICLLNSS